MILKSINHKKETILIVNEQSSNLLEIELTLLSHGYNVRKAINEQLAINFSRLTPPDLILLQVKGQKINGYKIYQQLSSIEFTQHIPIIFLGDLDVITHKIEKLISEKVDYIIEPFTTVDILRKIESKLMKKKEKKLNYKQYSRVKMQKYQDRQSKVDKVYNKLSNIINHYGIAELESYRDLTGKIIGFRCLLLNPIMRNILDINEEEVTDKIIFKHLLNKLDPKLFDELIKVIKIGKSLEKDLYCQNHCSENWYHLTAVKSEDKIILTIEIITKRKHTELEIQKIANLDSLTKVANRRIFESYLLEQWKLCAQEKQSLSLLIVNIDYFKEYNDTYGHLVGNDCLIIISYLLQRCLKSSDDLLARYGGEEFIIILPNTSFKQAVDLAQSIKNELASLKILNPNSPLGNYLTLSIGISNIIPQANKSPKILIETADQSLEQAKNQGRDRFVAYQISSEF